MTRTGAVRAGIWLSIYAGGGSLVGCLGFGLLWRGLSGRAWSEALLGLGLLLLGLDRAAVAFTMSMRARRSARPAPNPPAGGDSGRLADPRRPGTRG